MNTYRGYKCCQKPTNKVTLDQVQNQINNWAVLCKSHGVVLSHKSGRFRVLSGTELVYLGPCMKDAVDEYNSHVE